MAIAGGMNIRLNSNAVKIKKRLPAIAKVGWLMCMRGCCCLSASPCVERKRGPGEAEIEIYAHGDKAHPYIEVEQQGAYQTLAAGQSSSWTVQWDLVPAPADL